MVELKYHFCYATCLALGLKISSTVAHGLINLDVNFPAYGGDT